MNNSISTINWQNADIYIPEESNEGIIYCTVNNKIGTFNDIKNINHWNFLKDKYHIKWWCYQWKILPN